VIAGLICAFATARAEAKDLVVFAAASLKNALDDINALYAREKGERATTSYAASSALAKQIEAGAPADVFISADLDWMDYLAARQLIKAETRTNLLRNKIVLIATAGSTISLAVGPGFPLAQALGDGRLAMADPSSVPAGKYGKASLEALGVWSSVAGRTAPAASSSSTPCRPTCRSRSWVDSSARRSWTGTATTRSCATSSSRRSPSRTRCGSAHWQPDVRWSRR